MTNYIIINFAVNISIDSINQLN